MRTASTPFKPALEQLEDRVQPSFLLGGNAVQQMAAPLNNIVADMQSAQKDLIGIVKGPPPSSTTQGELNLAKVSADWQRLENDQHAITAISNADVNFINSVALTEFVSGDAMDLLVLKFGSIIGLNPTKGLTDPVQQANQIMQDQTFQSTVSDVNNVLSILTAPNNTSLTDLAPPPSSF